MPEEHKEEPKKEPEQTSAEPPQPNGAPTAEELAAIQAELDEEKKAITAAQAIIQQKNTLISDLQTQLSEARKGSEAAASELAQVKEAQSKAVARYLDVVKLANSSLPADVITGTTIDEIDASVTKATAIAEFVKKSLEARAKEARVPAGAPTRRELPLEGLSPREKIAAGIQQKGGM